MKKICIVITSRSSFSKYESVLKLLSQNKKIKIYVLLAFSAVVREFGDLSDFIKLYKVKIIKFDSLNKKQTLLNSIRSTSVGLNFFAEKFNNIKPNIVILMADRYEVISAAIAASYLNIKIIHFQGGELSGNIDGKVRHSISSLSDYHFVCNKTAKQMLEKKNLFKDVFLTGCPSIDLMKEAKTEPKNHISIIKKNMIVEKNFNYENYMILLNHPDTKNLLNLKKNFQELLKVIQKSNFSFIIFWPNADPGSDEISKLIRGFRESAKSNKNAYVINMNPKDYFKVLQNSKGIIGNSSSGIREAGFYGLPVVNLGNRQIDRERDKNVIDADYNSKNILKILNLKLKKYSSSKLYGDGKSSLKIVNIINRIL